MRDEDTLDATLKRLGVGWEASPKDDLIHVHFPAAAADNPARAKELFLAAEAEVEGRS